MLKQIAAGACCVAVMAGEAAAQSDVPRGFISVNGGYQMTARDFRDGAPFRENVENGRFDTDYAVGSGALFDLAGGVRVWRRLALGVGVTRLSNDVTADLSGTVPHPFFFGRPRLVSAPLGGMTRDERGVHVQARLVVPAGNKFEATFFGGPSFFQLTQRIVTGFNYSEEYPYDAVAFDHVDTVEATESAVGVNVGSDLALFFARHVGVGGTIQFATASVDVPSATGQTQDLKVGGTQVGAGIRFRF
jgi:hypothetical protein